MLNPFRRYRIDYVLFFSIAVFIVMLIAVITGVSYMLSARDQAASASFYQQGMLGELNKQLSIQLRAVEQTSLALSQNVSFLSYMDLKGDPYTRNKARIELGRDYLYPVVNSSPYLQTIEVYMDEPTYNDWMANVQFLPRSLLTEEPWFEAAQKADFLWVSQRQVNTTQGRLPVLSFVRHISSDANPNLGYLIVNVKLKALEALLGEDKDSPNRMLIDGGGRMMISTRTPPPQDELQRLTETLRGDSGYERAKLQTGGTGTAAGDMLMVWSRSFQENWLLVELTPWSVITSGSMRLAKTLALVGGAALVVTLFLTLTLSRYFTAPIRQLVHLMGYYSVGKQLTEFPDMYRNEFGSLFGGYRKLIERIEELYASLERQHRAQREAEIKALQASINPHFLYNTLDQLNWMAIEAGQDRISHVLELMGRMFRIGLSGGESFIPLHEELLHTECYMQIQQLKWGAGLTYSLELDDSLRELLIPKLTLQPFVENAVIHGFHGRSEGHIAISIAPQGSSTVVCRITDNGIGISPDWNKRKRRKTGGYGIRNVIERVEAYFGPPYGVTLAAGRYGGTEVTIAIPRKEQETGGEDDVENRAGG